MSPVSRATLTGSGGGTPITTYVQETEPAPQRIGDEWIKLSTEEMWVWNGATWMDLVGPPGSDADVAGHETAPDPHTQYTTLSEVDTRIASVVDAAPAALDTLNELAAALGDDADFAGTVTTQLAGKADAHAHPYAADTHNHDAAYAPAHAHPYAATSHGHTLSDVDIPATIARDAEVAAAVDDHAATPHGGDHPDLAAHDTLGLATQAELNGHNHDATYAAAHSHPYAATSHGHLDADLPAGLARDAEVAAAYSPLGHSHPPDTAAHAVTGAEHTATGMTTGQVLRATGATTFAWQTITDADLPATIARDSEVTSAISAHAAAGDPHSGYATDTDLTNHAGAADPHTGYQQESEKNAANGYAGLDAATLVPRARLGTGTADTTTFLRGDGTWQTPAGGGGAQAPWRTKIHTLWGDGNPNQQDVFWSFQNTVVSVAITPTNIGATAGRLVSFRYESAITVNTIRFFGVAAVANIYTAAIYSGTTRLWTATLNVAAGWNAIALGASTFTLPADTLCWFGIGANAIGTTAGVRGPASPVANSLGITTLPGNLATYANRFAQVALTVGAWPATLPALAAAAFASAGTTGTVPIFFADNA